MKVYKFIKDRPEDSRKLAPQGQVILDLIKEAGEVDRKALIADVEVAMGDGRIKTVQKATSLIGFYQGTLIDRGLIEVETIKAATKAPAADEEGDEEYEYEDEDEEEEAA